MKRVLAALAFASLGCTRGQMLDLAMQGAPHPAAHRGERVGPYEILAGDTHCHILPPDAPYHVSRDLAATAKLAEEQGLDFVVLTPHVPSRFFMDTHERAWVFQTQAELRARIAKQSTNVLFVPGMEYTDHRYGHIGLAFAEVSEVLEEVSLRSAIARPEAFFERWLAHGGTITINHPALHPIPRAPFRDLRGDLSWRGFFFDRTTLPSEVRFLTEHATAVETYNLSIGHLRDQFFFDDEDWTLRQGAHLAERAAREQERKITFVGGSDSHGDYLRGTTWLLAKERTKEGVRDAINAGRTCVRGPEACTFEARSAETDWVSVGSSIPSRHEVIEVRARGGPASFWVNGAFAGASRDGEPLEVVLPRTEGSQAKRCALVRAIVGRSWSAPIYVDCPWSATGS